MTSSSIDLVLAIDASTTACKALVFDAEGRILSEGRAELSLHNPEADAYEQNAEDWWLATTQAVKDSISAIGPERAAEIRAVAITHQRETFVITDRDGRPLHAALVWMDARCRKHVERAVRTFGAEALHALTGKPACTTPSFYKLMFLLERHPELRTAEARVLDVGAFLALRMTGRCATSLASADPLGLVDMGARSWSRELLEFLGLDTENVPELIPPGTISGTLDSHLARQLGLRESLPLVAAAGDGQAAGLGAGILEPGRAYLNLGTAIVSGVLSHSYDVDRAFRTLYSGAPGCFFLETDLKGGTFTFNWLVQKWLLRSRADVRPTGEILAELEAEAKGLPPGSDGLLVVPYWNGVMNPYWDDDATGIVVGWHGAHGPAHLYRAILEGLALEQRLHSAGVERATRRIDEFVVMGGGAASELWCQILADVLDRPIVHAGTREASALGAAILASVGAGIHPNVEAAGRAMSRTNRHVGAGPARSFYDDLYRRAYENLYPAIREQLGALARLRTRV